MTTASPLAEMFAGLEPAERAKRFEAYKSALQASIADAHSGRYSYDSVNGVKKIRPSGSRVASAAKMLERVEPMLKSAAGDQADALQNELTEAKAVLADIAKDWQVGVGGTTPNPSEQLVPYDLQRPVKELTPLQTPLRNAIPRNQMGEGLATHWRVLEGLQNSGVGTLGNISPFFSSQTDPGPTFGSLALRRGKKIDYETSPRNATYVEMGLSDLVTDVAQYSGLGFANHLQLSQHALTWTHLMGEERAILYGRGAVANGYSGPVAAPVISGVAGGTGSSLSAATYRVIVLANAGFGTSVRSNELAVAVTAGQNITVTVDTESAGALNYALYVTAAGGAANTETYQGDFAGNEVVVSSVTPGQALPANVDTSDDELAYDGLLTNLVHNGGYVRRHNAPLSTGASVGKEFQDAFHALYQEVFAQPDEIWLDSGVKVDLGQLLQNNAQQLPFRIQLSQTNGIIGTAVTGIQNQLNSQMVPLNVHPFMPQGAVMIRSTRIPFPAQGISATSEMRMVQDYMSIQWPKIQHTQDFSTYSFGTMIHYAPAFSGLLLGVQRTPAA